MKLLALAVTLLAVFAGCSETPATPVDPRVEAAEQSARAIPANVAANTGVVRGILLDQAGHPVSDAIVTVTPPRAQATVTPEGGFALGDLEPGRHLVVVGGPGYVAAEEFTVVAAGEPQPELLRFTLQRIVVAPAVEWREYDRGVDTHVQGVNVISHAHGVIPLEPGATVVQFEFTWTPQSPFTQTLLASIGYDPQGQPVYQVPGTSPLVVRVNATYQGQAMTYADGFLQIEDANGNELGLNQQYHLRIDAFYGFVPRADWTYGNDGDYPVPGA